MDLEADRARYEADRAKDIFARRDARHRRGDGAQQPRCAALPRQQRRRHRGQGRASDGDRAVRLRAERADAGRSRRGSTPSDQPYGVSFTGTACSEPRLIELAYAFEQATHGASRRPARRSFATRVSVSSSQLPVQKGPQPGEFEHSCPLNWRPGNWKLTRITDHRSAVSASLVPQRLRRLDAQPAACRTHRRQQPDDHHHSPTSRAAGQRLPSRRACRRSNGRLTARSRARTATPNAS